MNKSEKEKIPENIWLDKDLEYQKKAEEFINNLDFARLESIKAKSITEISEEDLVYIGFERILHEDYDVLYNYRNFDNIKIYLHRLPDKFELLGYRLKKEKDINTVQELLDNTLLKWKLKLYASMPNIKIDYSEEDLF